MCECVFTVALMGHQKASAAGAGVHSWLHDWYPAITRYMRQLVGTVLGYGPVPRHIAFIMDGNRRFAERRREDRAAGHTYGFYKVRCCQASLHFLPNQFGRLLTKVSKGLESRLQHRQCTQP